MTRNQWTSLLSRLATHDSELAGLLFDEIHDYARHLFYKTLPGAHLGILVIDDLIHDAAIESWLRIVRWARMGKINMQHNPKGFVGRTILNELIRSLESRRYRTISSTDTIDLHVLTHPSCGTPFELAALSEERKHLFHIVQHVLITSPPLWALSFILPSPEVARLTGHAAATVRSWKLILKNRARSLVSADVSCLTVDSLETTANELINTRADPHDNRIAILKNLNEPLKHTLLVCAHCPTREMPAIRMRQHALLEACINLIRWPSYAITLEDITEALDAIQMCDDPGTVARLISLVGCVNEEAAWKLIRTTLDEWPKRFGSFERTIECPFQVGLWSTPGRQFEPSSVAYQAAEAFKATVTEDPSAVRLGAQLLAQNVTWEADFLILLLEGLVTPWRQIEDRITPSNATGIRTMAQVAGALINVLSLLDSTTLTQSERHAISQCLLDHNVAKSVERLSEVYAYHPLLRSMLPHLRVRLSRLQVHSGVTLEIDDPTPTYKRIATDGYDPIGAEYSLNSTHFWWNRYPC